jgi:hypothetical protein
MARSSPPRRHLRRAVALVGLIVGFSNLATGASLATEGSGAQIDFSAISCASSSYCVAIGHDEHGLATRSFDGSRWHSIASPTSISALADLQAIDCVAVGHCLAVGSDQKSEILHSVALELNRGSWHELSTPRFSGNNYSLSGISCPTERECVAVGSRSSGSLTGSVFELWNGSRFSAMSGPPEMATTNNISTIDDLASVSCHTLHDCIAVSAGGGVYLFDGKAWILVSSYNGFGTSGNLFGVSCPSSTWCLAVGREVGEPHEAAAVSLLETYDGKNWRDLTPPRNDYAASGLEAVDCAAASRCAAIGTYETATNGLGTLLETWNGHAWLVRLLPIDGRSSGRGLDAIACPTTTHCIAVGTAGRIESFSGGSWSKLA